MQPALNGARQMAAICSRHMQVTKEAGRTDITCWSRQLAPSPNSILVLKLYIKQSISGKKDNEGISVIQKMQFREKELC
jgi:hypothetical protein